MAFEIDTPPPQNTFRRVVWQTVAGLAFLRAYWGRRLAGGAIGLMADALSEGASQAFYARLPGHPQQAPDSLTQVGRDRDLFRFRGETDDAWEARVHDAWTDYEQAGTPQQLLHVVNQWGQAGWPSTWNTGLITLVESVDPAVFQFTLTIGFGTIDPPWTIATYGSGHVYGEFGLFYGVGANTDLPTLLYLVRKWKPARSQAKVKIYTSVSAFVVFTL